MFLSVSLSTTYTAVDARFVVCHFSCLFCLFFLLFTAYTGSTADVEEICDEEAGEISVVVAVPCGKPRYFSS